MPALLVADLSTLTGEQLYHLVVLLCRACEEVSASLPAPIDWPCEPGGHQALYEDLMELRDDALIQIGRITVPLAEAQAIIQRALISRNRPVRVSPTT